MSIHFKLMPRRNPQDAAAAPRYYAHAVPTSKQNLRALSKRVASHTTMSAPDIYGVLMALEEEIILALQDGANVELGDLCIFYPVVQSEGVDNEADFNAAAHITRKTIKIRPKQKLSKQMSEISVQRTS